MRKLMLPKLDVNYAKDPTTPRIALLKRKMKHLKRHIIHNLVNHSNLQEDLGKLLQVITKGTTLTRLFKKGGKLWMIH